MRLIIFAKCWNNLSRTVHVVLWTGQGMPHFRSFVTNSWVNDLEYLSQGLRSLHVTHPLMIVTISAKYENNSPRTLCTAERTRLDVTYMWIIFLPNFILYRDFTSRYISYRIVYSILVGAGHIYIYIYIYMCVYVYVYMCMYVYVCVYIYVHVYMYIYACECMLLCIHDYMYVFYVCSFYVYWFYDVFYLWLLGQRWPNKEV